MARICFDDVIKHVHGALTGKSKVVFKHYSPSNINYSAAKPEGRTTSVTVAERQNRQKFAAAIAAVDTIMSDPEQLEIYRAQFKTQKKYVLLRNYIMAQIWSTI